MRRRPVAGLDDGDRRRRTMTRREKGRTLAADQLPVLPPRARRGHAARAHDRRRHRQARPGGPRAACCPPLRDERGIDIVTANGENLAGGMGLTMATARALFACGVDVITSGNHIWDKREIIPELDRDERILRPLNYGTTRRARPRLGHLPCRRRHRGRGHQRPGPATMVPIENPFTELDRLLDEAADELPAVRLVDFHCELTSEKTAFGLYLDGRVSAVVGTHTHVPTADERTCSRAARPTRATSGMTGPARQRHRFRARDGAAALHQRPADALRGRQRAGRLQRARHRHRDGHGTRPQLARLARIVEA